MHNKYYEQGWRARGDYNMGIKANPYSYGSYERAQWEKGYLDCKQWQYVIAYSN